MKENDRYHERHRSRMIRKKAVVDAAIARATEQRGLLLVITGNGKGKSSSAFGMVARALGHGMKVAVFNSSKAKVIPVNNLFFNVSPMFYGNNAAKDLPGKPKTVIEISLPPV